MEKFPAERDDRKIFEKNVRITLNVLYAKKKMHPAYYSKNISNCEKQVIFVIISNV